MTAAAARWLAVSVVVIVAYLIAHPHIAEAWQIFIDDYSAKTTKAGHSDAYATRDGCQKEADRLNSVAARNEFWSCHRTYELQWGWRAAS